MSELDRAIELLGGQANLARAVGVTVQAVHKWTKSGVVPAARVLAVEAATQRRVTRYELRPDVYPKDDVQAA